MAQGSPRAYLPSEVLEPTLGLDVDVDGERSCRKQVLFIGGSLNQTTQVRKVAACLPEVDAWFSPYYCDGILERARRRGWLDWTILGEPWQRDTFDYLNAQGLNLDVGGVRGGYDLVVTCSDLIVPRNIGQTPLVLVQEGMTDPEGWGFWLRRLLPFLPTWIAGTGGTGTSNRYTRFCVASHGYRQLFVDKGARAEKVVVTGIPNFDDCEAYRRNDFPHRGFVLVCTSDTRETWKLDNRMRFLRRAKALAAGKPLVFKLHPNENWERSSREIRSVCPDALIYTRGKAEEMVANCDVLVVQYSSLAFVGLALKKEVHAYSPVDELRALLPEQGGRAAVRIAEVCREVLASRPVPASVEAEDPLDEPLSAQPLPLHLVPDWTGPVDGRELQGDAS
jgi:hypothetical protein